MRAHFPALSSLMAEAGPRTDGLRASIEPENGLKEVKTPPWHLVCVVAGAPALTKIALSSCRSRLGGTVRQQWTKAPPIHQP